jgi:hypothetical protein
VNTLTLLSGQWMPSRLRYPLLFLLPLLLFGASLLPGERFLPQLPVSYEPLASEFPEAAQAATQGANLVASDRLFPILSDELEIRAQISTGTFPTWNPKAGVGSPLVASSLAPPWNPLRWPLLMLDPALAGGWHALFSLVLAGLGMLMFLEGRGLKFTAAMFGSLAYQSSGFLIANLHYVMKVDAAIWAPWCLWGVDLVFRERKNAGLIVAFGLGMSALAGFVPVFVFVAGLTLVWIFKRTLEAIRDPRESLVWKASLQASLAFAGLGVLAGSVYLLPMLEASHESTRQSQGPEAILAQSLPHAALATAVMPNVFGPPSSKSAASNDPAVWWLTDKGDLQRALLANRLEWQLFVGVTVLALAVAGLFAKTRRALFPGLIVLGTCGFIFGWPVFDWLYGLPGANLGAPARAAPIAALALAWLSALGFDALLEGNRSARLGVMSVGLVFALIASYLWISITPETWAIELEQTLQARFAVDLETVSSFFSREDALIAAQRIQESAKWLLLICVLVLVLAKYAGRLTVRGSGVAGCALLVFEATLAGIPQAEVPRVGGDSLFPASETIQAIAQAAGDGRVLRIDRSESGIEDVLQLARPNLLQVYGIADLTPYTVFPSKRLSEIWKEFDPAGLYRKGVACLSDESRLSAALLDALRVTCILSRTPLDHPRLQLRHEAPGFYVYARSGAFALARIVPALATETADIAARMTSRTQEQFKATAFSDSLDGFAVAPLAFAPGQLQFARPFADRIDVGLKDSSGGWLVVHEGWAPGWKATIDGQDAEVLRLDHLFFGLQVPAGSSVIRFKYEPWSLRIGTLISLLAVFSAFWFTRRRHRNRTIPSVI